MTLLNQLEVLIHKAFPTAQIEVSEPASPDGFGFLDISLKGSSITVQWQQPNLFGVSTPEEHGYGEKPDEIYYNIEQTVDRIIHLLQSGQRTASPLQVRLREGRVGIDEVAGNAIQRQVDAVLDS